MRFVAEPPTGPEPIDGPQAREIVSRWTSAFSRRDLDALIALADPQIAYHPTILARGRRVYHGHDGLRAWLADLDQAGVRHTVSVSGLRPSVGGQLLVFGEIMDADEPVCPFAMVIRFSGHRLIEVHAHLSDEAMMRSLGMLEPQPEATG